MAAETTASVPLERERRLRDSGVNPRIVSARLGHSMVALTLDVYSHVLPQADAEAASQIAALLEASDG